MSTLEEIKARLEISPRGPLSVVITENLRWADVLEYPGTAGETRIARCADSDYAELFAHAPEDLTKMIAALEAVGALHPKVLGGTPDGSFADFCGGCPNYYPCPTVAAIQAALA